jgi:hypothetical protein
MKRQPKRKHLLKRKPIDAKARRECRREFLIAASKHKEILLVDSLDEEVFFNFPEGDKFEHLLRRWARHWHLNYPWVLTEARNLYDSRRRPDSRELAPFTFETSKPAHLPPLFGGPAWVENGPPDYEERFLASFKDFLSDWIKQCKGIRKRLQQRHRRHGQYTGQYHRPDHYLWAAEHICLKRGWTQIAEKNDLGINISGVRDAVHKVLDDIQLPRKYKAKRG